MSLGSTVNLAKLLVSSLLFLCILLPPTKSRRNAVAAPTPPPIAATVTELEEELFVSSDGKDGVSNDVVEADAVCEKFWAGVSV